MTSIQQIMSTAKELRDMLNDFEMEEPIGYTQQTIDSDEKLMSFCHFVCDEIVNLSDSNFENDASRWLGVVLGVLWMKGICTLEEISEAKLAPSTLPSIIAAAFTH